MIIKVEVSQTAWVCDNVAGLQHDNSTVIDRSLETHAPVSV